MKKTYPTGSLPINIQLFADDTPPGLINEELLRLTEDNKMKDLKIAQLEKEKESLQLDYTNKITDQKIAFETKELEYKKQIRELRTSLEVRVSYEKEKESRRTKKSVNQMYEEILGK